MSGSYDPLRSPGPGRGLAHAPSYWAATVGDAPPDDGALDGDREAEVAIIGGGYTGLSCALHLARDFGIKPVLLEANRPGWGCSGRNGSFARPSLGRLDHADWVRLWGEETARAVFAETLEAVGTLRGLIEQGPIACDVQPGGYLRIAHKPGRMKGLEATHRLLERVFGYRTELLDTAAIARDHFVGEEAYGALRWPDAFGTHPLKLVLGMLRLARAAGAVVHGASPVERWTKDGARHVLHTPGGRVVARRVVVATNGYTPEGLHPMLKAKLVPVLSNIVVTRPVTAAERQAANLLTTHCLSDTRELVSYFRMLPDGRLMLGSRGSIAEGTAGFAAYKEKLLAIVRRKFPALAQITGDYFWGGWVAISYDGMPHIHHAADDPTVHYAMGYGGTGVTAATHAGRRLAEHMGGGRPLLSVLDRPIPAIPLAFLRVQARRGAFLWYRFRDAVL